MEFDSRYPQWSKWIAAIEDRGVNLTVWEESFFESVQEKHHRYGDQLRLSDAQAESLENIYANRVP